MARDTAEHGVPLLLCTVPVNLRDWRPVVSHHSLQEAERAAWQECYDTARKHLFRQAGYTEGILAMRKALDREPDHAESHFWLARLQEAAGRKSAALAGYHRAVDLDYTPFRAISAFNESIRQTARDSANVTLLDLEALFVAACDRGAPGFDLFLDHVHPTRRGNLIVARHAFALLDRLLPGSAETPFSPPPARPGGQPYQDFHDILVVRTVFNMAAVNHQYDRALRAIEAMAQCEFQQKITGPDDVNVNRLHPHFAQAYRVFSAYQELQHRLLRGESVSAAEKQRVQEALDEYYDAEYPYGTF